MRAILFVCILTLASCVAGAEEKPEPKLTHTVFFQLKESDEESVQALIDACYEYLEPHDGIVYFSAGPRHTDYQRDVNDLTFDVALTVVFEDTAAQDAYQVTEPHKQFIELFSDNWEGVRVFDSFAPPTSE